MSKIRTLYFLLLVCICQSCNSNPYSKGETVYKNMCARCHMEDGSGLEGNIPALKNMALYQDMPALTCTIVKGRGENEDLSLEMPAFDQLSEIDLTNLINFLSHQFGDDKQYIPNDVTKMKGMCTE